MIATTTSIWALSSWCSLASAATWFLAEFTVLRLGEISDNYDSAALDLIHSARPPARAQVTGVANIVPQGVGLLGGSDFESASVGSWQNVGGIDPGAYKVITDTNLDDLPNINMKAFTFCSQSPSATLDTYHDFSICTPPGSSSNWMCAKNLDKDYPNRFVITTDGSDPGTTFDF